MFNNIEKVTILGAGGSAAYYISKFFLFIGDTKVDCYDMNKNERTEELKALGANVFYFNPPNFAFLDSDLIIYTRALPSNLINEINNQNPSSKVYSAGDYYEYIIESYENELFNKNPSFINAIKKSDIAPLFDIDFSDSILIGVTGSKGKTTTTHMIYETLYNLGADVSGCTTIGARIKGREIETGLHTSTPSAQELAYIFKEMLKAKSKIIVLEASSHAIATGRIAGLKFDIAIITNLQPEHLDFHKTIDHVIETKQKLAIDFLKPNGKIILNIDDKNIKDKVLPALKTDKKNIYTISLNNLESENSNSFIVNDFQETKTSVSFHLLNNRKTEEYVVPYPGIFNIYNIAPSIIISKFLGYTEDEIKNAISMLGVVSGRNEIIQESPIKVVLDFAHTAESLEAILSTYRKICENNKLIVVFGAAGQRDTLKRPRMGAVAAKYADITILTAEDPRTEDLAKINEEIKAGWQKYIDENNLIEERIIHNYDDISMKENCRREAIKKAVELAKPGDIIICAGKGPEKSMCIGFEERKWDEREIIKEILTNNI